MLYIIVELVRGGVLGEREFHAKGGFFMFLHCCQSVHLIQHCILLSTSSVLKICVMVYVKQNIRFALKQFLSKKHTFCHGHTAQNRIIAGLEIMYWSKCLGRLKLLFRHPMYLYQVLGFPSNYTFIIRILNPCTLFAFTSISATN